MQRHNRCIMTVVGTRPELIRLAEVIRKIDRHYQHVFVHTGQNFDAHLHEQFFADLGLRRPDYQFNIEEKRVGFDFVGALLPQIARVIDEKKPGAALILGDTNSALAAYACKQRGVPVFHMEAGNRCYNDEVPEEVNRRIVDTCSDYLLTYTQRSREQLLREGYHPSRIHVTGNPITEVLTRQLERLGQEDSSRVLSKLGVTSGEFALVTMHRTENVTDPGRLRSIMAALNAIAEQRPVVLSLHPKLRSMLTQHSVDLHSNIKALPPFSFSEFILLMKSAWCVLSDSGTVPEEACVLQVPCVLVRSSTERPELLENDSMVLSGTDTGDILGAVSIVTASPIGAPPSDYRDLDVSDKVVKLLARELDKNALRIR